MSRLFYKIEVHKKIAKNWSLNMKFRYLNIPFRERILLEFSLMEALSRREAYSCDGSRQRRKRIVFTISWLLIIGYLLAGTFAVACPLIHAQAAKPSSDRSCPWTSQLNTPIACHSYVALVEPQWIPVFTFSFAEDLYSFTFQPILHSRAPPQPF